jgi:hypothetical protein
MTDAGGEPVSAAPGDIQLRVRISAHGASPERLRTLVESSHRRSPMLMALENAMPINVHIDVAHS